VRSGEAGDMTHIETRVRAVFDYGSVGFHRQLIIGGQVATSLENAVEGVILCELLNRGATVAASRVKVSGFFGEMRKHQEAS
jgi:hypothetical protein